MIEIKIHYQGKLRCAATHGPSGDVLATDAPVDNNGRGEAFSPTDLLAASLGSCMATVMGIVAQRGRVLARQLQEIGAARHALLGHAAQIAGRVLDPDDHRMLG